MAYRKSTTEAYGFEPDPETRQNVTRIFKMRIDGVPLNHIANTFNEEGIPSPGKLHYLRGMTSDKRYATSIWSVQLIKQILKNPTYLGHLVFGRMSTALYLGKPNYQYEPDENKWGVLENMHEPLVTQEQFDIAKKMEIKGREEWIERTKKFAKQREENQPFFYDYIFCGDCGIRMIYHRTTKNGNKTGSYNCGNYRHAKCNGTHSIAQERLKEIVWQVIQDQMDMYCDLEKVVELIKNKKIEVKEQTNCIDEKKSLAIKMKTNLAKREQLYEDYTDGILSPEEYQLMKQRFDNEYQQLSEQYNKILVKERKLQKALSDENEWLVHIQKIKDQKNFTRDILEALVDKVLIYQTGKKERRVEVRLKYQEDFNLLKAVYEETKGGE